MARGSLPLSATGFPLGAISEFSQEPLRLGLRPRKFGGASTQEDAMATETRQYPVVESVIDIFARWLKHRREIAESCNCDSEEYAHIARDLNVSPGELDELVRRGAHAADALPKMMAELHIDQRAVVRVEPMVMRDLERVCSLCDHKRRCARELAAGTGAQHYADYCPNASTLKTLVVNSG